MGTIQDNRLSGRGHDARQGELTLGSAPRGCRLRVTRLCSGPRENCRLCALGLTPGTQVQVLSCGGGASRLLVRGCNLVLDPGLAQLVACELV